RSVVAALAQCFRRIESQTAALLLWTVTTLAALRQHRTDALLEELERLGRGWLRLRFGCVPLRERSEAEHGHRSDSATKVAARGTIERWHGESFQAGCSTVGRGRQTNLTIITGRLACCQQNEIGFSSIRTPPPCGFAQQHAGNHNICSWPNNT